MKKVIVGLAAAGAAVALWTLLKERMAQTMREHCEQMAAQHAARGEPVGTT
jgi:hypothetical protein